MKVSGKKIVRTILSLIMMLFACVQLNDPDPWGWILAYGIISVSGLLGSAKQNGLRMMISVGYLILGIWLFPSAYYGLSEMNDMHPEIEQARESFGVLIAAGINIINVWLFKLEWKNLDSKEAA